MAVVVCKMNVHHLFLLNNILTAFKFGQIDDHREVHLLLRFILNRDPVGWKVKE